MGRAAKLLSNSSGEHPKRLPVGFYDPAILCAPCDASLGVWDQYAVELLCRGLSRFTPSAAPTPGVSGASGTLVAFQLASYDYRRLKLFVLAVLWRAGTSSLRAFRRVTLGPYGPRLREMLIAGDPGAPDDFCTALSAFTVQGALPPEGLPIMDPFRERWDRVNAYRLSFGVVTAYVKVDRAPLPDILRRVSLTPGQPLALVARDFRSSSEAAVARAIVTTPINQAAFRERT